MCQVVRVAGGARGAASTFRRHRFSENDSAGLAQARDRRCIRRRHSPAIRFGAVLAWLIDRVDDVFDADFTEAGAVVFNHDTIAGKTANDDGNFTNPPSACRLAITAHTAGSATLNIVQAGGLG